MKKLVQNDIVLVLDTRRHKCNNNPMNQLMTRFVIANYFDVSERTIERWEALGMPTVKIGKIRRYDLEKVMEWINSKGLN